MNRDGRKTAVETLRPAQVGHFLLESGLHTNRWFELDALFCEPRTAASLVDRLAALLAPFDPEAICGPLVGGALLARSVAARMDARFLFTARVADAGQAPFAARYALPPGQRPHAAGRRIAIVDDMISAGSSTRATWSALRNEGCDAVVVGTLFLSGTVGERHFSDLGVPLVAVERLVLDAWLPDACPLCAAGVALNDAGD